MYFIDKMFPKYYYLVKSNVHEQTLINTVLNFVDSGDSVF